MNRNTIITQLKNAGLALIKNGAERENIRWTIAEKATALEATYAAGNEKAFLAAAATAAQLTEGDIGNLVRAYKVRQDLTKVQAEKVSSWTTDAMLTLRGKEMTTGNRTKLIAKSEKVGTQNVKKLREYKKAIIGSSPRNRQNATDVKIALAKKLEKDLARLFKSHDVLALVAGAQFAQDHPGQDIAAVLTFAAAQRVPVTA